MPKLTPTAEITLGPFFPPRYVDPGANDLTQLDGRAARGEPIEIHGRVTQRTACRWTTWCWRSGRPTRPASSAIRRSAARATPIPVSSAGVAPRPASDGHYRFTTIRPGAYAMPDGTLRAPHVNVIVLFSGLMRQLQTVMFFDGEPGNATDPVLAAVQPRRRCAPRLVAKRGRRRLPLRHPPCAAAARRRSSTTERVFGDARRTHPTARRLARDHGHRSADDQSASLLPAARRRQPALARRGAALQARVRREPVGVAHGRAARRAARRSRSTISRAAAGLDKSQMSRVVAGLVARGIRAARRRRDRRPRRAALT